MTIIIVAGLAVFAYGMFLLARWALRTGYQEPKKRQLTARQRAYRFAWYNEDHEHWSKYRWYELTAQARKDGFVDGDYV